MNDENGTWHTCVADQLAQVNSYVQIQLNVPFAYNHLLVSQSEAE